MRELSLHILDIAKNSTAAGAKRVTIALNVDTGADKLSFTVKDDGKGMSEEFLARVTDPFTTTRTTRKVGLGLPLLKMAAESTGGKLTIASKVGEGTEVTAEFGLTHIDRMPLGDFGATMVTLVTGDTECEFAVKVTVDGASFELDTEKLRGEMGGVPLDEPEVAEFLRGYFNENLKSLYGGEL